MDVKQDSGRGAKTVSPACACGKIDARADGHTLRRPPPSLHQSAVSPSSKSVARKPASAAAKKSADKPRPFEVRRSRIQGRGVFATAQIRKGKKLIEYVGEPITPEEADRRYDDANGRHHTFLFVLNDTTVLDARRGGNDARFINHSCEPNCETVIDDDHIWIRSIKPIAPETELVYDYRFEWDDEYEPHDIRYYACRCGSKKCRGTILRVPVYLRPTVREWLAGNDVAKPRKPRKKSAVGKGVKKGVEKSVKKGVKKSVKKGVKKGAPKVDEKKRKASRKSGAS